MSTTNHRGPDVPPPGIPAGEFAAPAVSEHHGVAAVSRADARDAALTQLLDKQELYENMALYCRGQDRKDLALVKSTFWPEATDDHGMFNGPAHEFCEWAFENQKVTKHRSHHYITNVLIDIEDDRARRESAVVYVMVRPDGGSTEIMGGRYRDLCERREGEWKVLRRVVIFDHVAQLAETASLAGVFGGISSPRVGAVYPHDPIHEAEW